MRLLRKFFRKLRGRKSSGPGYVYQPDHTVITDFCEFSGATPSDVERSINEYEQLCQADWRITPGNGFDEKSANFYENSKNYIYDLLLGNVSKKKVIEKLDAFTPQILQAIKSHPGKDFLEFGGGTGVMCEVVHGLGKSVTCLDIPGLPQQFARWRFRKYGLPIEIAVAKPDSLELTREYDIIFTDAVLEHLAPERQMSAVETLCRHTLRGGILLLLIDLAGKCEENPTHTEVDVAALHRIAHGNGFTCLHGENTFCSIWQKGA
jgi:protein-L-isoaspartate O-methyltransferase